MKKIIRNSLLALGNRIYEILQMGRKFHLTKDMNLGKNVFIRYPLNVFYPKNITIDDYASINSGLTILAHEKVYIGSYTMIATNVSIITVNHDYKKLEKDAQKAHLKAPINIGKNVWIGANAVILPGVTIGDGAVIGAGSIVTHDISPYSIAVGVPAKTIKKRIVENNKNIKS